MKRWLVAAFGFALVACGRSGALGSGVPLAAQFPMYVTVPGAEQGSGAIYRIEQPDDDGEAAPEAVISGLTFPTGIAVAEDETIFFTVKLPSPDGALYELARGSSSPELVTDGLNNPEDAALDSFGRVYIAESSGNRVIRIEADGAITVVTKSVAAPRGISSTDQDELLVTEQAGGIVSSVSPGGTREVLRSASDNPRAALRSSDGVVYVLSGRSGLADGAMLKAVNGASYLTGLVNPSDFCAESAGLYYVVEGLPANRIIRFDPETGGRTLVASLPGDPKFMSMTPRR